MKGLLLPASASRMASTAGASTLGSYVVAMLITALADLAPEATAAGLVKSPRTGVMPAASSLAAA
jgi:hypothetical protein